MDRLFRGVISCFFAAVLAGCAGSTRAPDPEPSSNRPTAGTNADRAWRAALLMAEDYGRIDEPLRAGLTSENPERRRLSFRALGRIADPSMIDALVTGFEDNVATVRAEAIFAAAISGAEETIGKIAEKRSDADPQVRAAVATALGLFGNSAGIEPLIDLLSDDTDGVRVSACYSAARLSDADAIVEPLLEMLDDPDREVASASLYALSRLSSRGGALGFATRFKVRKQLVELAESKDLGVQLLVAEGLYNPVAGEQADALHALMQSTESPEVLLAIIRSTSFPGAPAFVIHETTIEHKDERVVHGTLLGLGRMKGELVNGLLLGFIVNDSRDWLRAEAVRSLGKAGFRTFLTVANGLSNAEQQLIRAATAEALYGSDGEAAATYARRLFQTDDAWVKIQAIPTMAAVEEPLGIVFRDLLRSGTIEQQVQVARAAGYRLEMEGRSEDDRDDAIRLLTRLWRDARERRSIALQFAVIDAAAESRNEAGAELIRQALKADDLSVRRHAAAVLQSGFDETVEVVRPREKPLSYYEEIVDWAARQHAALITVERQGFVPGRFTVALDSRHAPMTAFRFARLAGLGYYDNRQVDPYVPGLRWHSGRGGGDRYVESGWRPDPVFSLFGPGTLAAVNAADDAVLGEWLITLTARPNYLGRYSAFGRVVQNLGGVAANVLPIDRVVSVRVYDGSGREPFPPLR